MPPTSWPATVPVLEAEDICKGHLNGPNGTHCLGGWIYEAFPCNEDKQVRVMKLLQAECDIESGGGFSSIANYNDAMPKEDSAALWNRVMRRLGYTEVE